MKKNLLTLGFIFSLITVFSQDLKMTWSPEIKMTNKTGFFSNIIGKNDNYLYVKYITLSKIRIAAFDKISMKEKFSAPIKGFPENKATKADFKGLQYYRTVVFKNSVYIFWIRENKEQDELFVQSFDANLKSLKPLKKIYELKSFKGAKKKAELFILENNSLGEKILIGGENAGNKGDKVKVEYKILNSDFTFSNAGQSEIPVEITGRSNYLSSSYTFGDDGNLHVKSENSLTVVNLENGTKNTYVAEFTNKKIVDFDYTIDEKSIRLFGLFCDLTKDKSGSDNHGIFYAIINSTSLKLESENFTYFTKEQLDKLFTKDDADRKDSKLFQSKKGKESEEESLKSSYCVDKVVKDGDDLLLVCSIMYNYYVTTTHRTSNGGTYTTSDPYCNRRNVTIFRISNKGEIEWATNIDRNITYPGHYIYDINVIRKENLLYVTYGSNFIDNDEAKKKKCCAINIASLKEMRDKIAYATFDVTNGVATKKEIIINDAKTPKAERKIVNPSDINVLEGDFYLYSEKYNIHTPHNSLSLIGLLFKKGSLKIGCTSLNNTAVAPKK